MRLNNDLDEELKVEIEKFPERNKGNPSKRISISRIILIYCLLGIFGWYFFQFLFHSNLFRIKDVIIQGNNFLDENTIFHVSGVRLDSNIFLLDKEKLISNLANEPWIMDVEVKKIFPDKITINIREREAAAVVNIGKRCCKCSKDGVILCFLNQNGKKDEKLPLINGYKNDHYAIGERIIEPNFRDALEIIYCIEVILPKMFCEVRIMDSGIFLVCNKNESIKIRVNKAEEIINGENLIREALEKISYEQLEIDYLDLRFQDSLIMKVNK